MKINWNAGRKSLLVFATLILAAFVSGCDSTLGIDGLEIGCIEATKQCRENTPQVCNEQGQWLDEAPCDHLTCVLGVCSGNCAPDDKRCAEENSPQICDAQGHWKADAPCVNQACVAGTCTGVCTPETLACGDKNLMKCGSDGQWALDTECEYGCKNDVCTCTTGQQRCSNENALETCNENGEWQISQMCSSTTQTCDQISLTCVGECVPGKRCLGDTPQDCDEHGQWANRDKPCDAGMHCKAGECVVECASGDRRCFDNKKQTCNATGVWQDDDTCVDQTCDPVTVTCIGVCAPGKRCNGAMPQVCDVTGQWADEPMTCQIACVDGECAACSVGELGCSKNTPQTCIPPGQWQDQPGGACVEQTCIMGSCQGECAAASIRCAGSIPQTCNAAGSWENNPVPCANGTSCYGGLCLVDACTFGDVRCVGDHPQKCDAQGAWQSNGQVCPACVECNPDIGACGAPQSSNACGEPIAVLAGPDHVCAILPSLQIKCWGFGHGLSVNAWPDFGDDPGEMGNNLPTVNLGTGVTVSALALSEIGSHNCAILTGGNIKCWGNNFAGQLGLGNTDTIGYASNQMGDNLLTVDLGTATASSIALGYAFTCAILADGSVKCWGDNGSGQLGLGDTQDRGDNAGEMGNNLPTVNLGTGLTATAIAAGFNHVCVIVTGGLVKCWGYNGNGQLGLGDLQSRGGKANEMGDNLPPVNIGTGLIATAITAGGDHTCVLLSSGAIKCWGANSVGELGLGNPLGLGYFPTHMGDNLPAVNVGTGLSAIELAAGWHHTCALLSNGGVKCWGLNLDGQLGLGNTESRGDGPGEMGDALPFVNLGVGASVSRITCGRGHTCALLVGGSLKCWGNNVDGQLGLGDTADRGVVPNQMGDNLPIVDL